jgi:regulator of replication initiation timing
MNGGKTWAEMLVEIEVLRAENERLRAALGMISDIVDCHEPKTAINKSRKIARAALKGGDG